MRVFNDFGDDGGERTFLTNRPVCPVIRRGACGFAGGTVCTATVGFTTQFLAEEPPELAGLAVGGRALFGTAVVERTSEGQLRTQSLYVEIEEPISIGSADVLLIDHVASLAGHVFCALSADQRLALYGVRSTVNLLTGESTVKLRQGALPYEPRSAAGGSLACRNSV